MTGQKSRCRHPFCFTKRSKHNGNSFSYFQCAGAIALIVSVLAATACSGGAGNSSSGQGSPPPTTVRVSPSIAALVATTQTQQFSATVTGTSNLNVVWSVDGTEGGSIAVGTISSAGLYTPPSTPGTHTVAAASAANSDSSGSATVAITDLAGVTTHHNDLSRDGVNTQEYALNANDVNPTTFGKLFSCATATASEAQVGEGAIFTQPLWMPSLIIAGGVHNVIFVATQHDTVFAFDADANPCVTYWQVNLLDAVHGGTSGETPVSWNNVGCQCGVGDIYPEVGVTGTPVIDPTSNTIYLVSKSQSSTTGTFYQRLHALDLASGNEKFSAPVNIAASVVGVGDGGSTVFFNPQMENQRLGLALAAGTVYVGWSAHEDAAPWHGWLFGYSAADVQQQVAVFNTSPNAQAGGIWAGGGAPAIDSDGNIYFSTGNGTYDASLTGMPGNNDYGDTVLKLTSFLGSTSNGQNLNIADWFTPDDQSCLANSDTDLGAGEPILLPDQTGPIAHLLVEMGKEGVVYLLNRDNMGQLQANNCSGGNGEIVQTFLGSSSGFYGTPAFWQNNLYFGGSLDSAGAGDYLKIFSFNPETGLFDTAPSSQSEHYYNFPGASPSVSSQGSANGIVWAIDASAYGYANPNGIGGINCFQVPVPSECAGPAVLHAYTATNLAEEYWNSTMAAGNRDQAGNAVKFVPPTVANGKVYVSTRTEVDVYGLLPQ